MNNYKLMENFLIQIKDFALYNPNKYLTKHFIYSLLICYNIDNPLENITDKFLNLYQYFQNTDNIHLYEVPNFNFLILENGFLTGNEIKLYIPYDSKHIIEAAKKIFDFISFKNICHQSKISYISRNDDLVIRVNTLEDAEQIISFIKGDPFLNNNLLNVNPFLPNNQSIGMAMDNKLSFNLTLCEIISDFVLLLQRQNRLYDLNVQNLNAYIKEQIPNVSSDKKGIYKILAGTTEKNYSIQDFYAIAEETIYGIDPQIGNAYIYLDQAIIFTEKYHKGYGIPALKSYISAGVYIGFTRKNNARENLVHNISPMMAFSLISEYLKAKNITYKDNDEAVKLYVENILGLDNLFYTNYGLSDNIKESDLSLTDIIDVIKNAYNNTRNKYGKNQAKTFLFHLLTDYDLLYCTNQFGDRDLLKKINEKYDLKKCIFIYFGGENINSSFDEIFVRIEEFFEGRSL